MTAAERLVAAFARGLVHGLLDVSPVDQPGPSPVVDSAEQRVASPRVTIPDIAPPEEIDLFAQMKEQMHEGDTDLSDVASVEAALQQIAAAREAAANPPIGEGTRRVRAPDA
jgi:hypothetical protein